MVHIYYQFTKQVSEDSWARKTGHITVDCAPIERLLRDDSDVIDAQVVAPQIADKAEAEIQQPTKNGAISVKNDCSHRGVCKYINDGMCLTECGHYTKEEKLTPTNDRMIALKVFEEFLMNSEGEVRGPFQAYCLERLDVKQGENAAASSSTRPQERK